jgi:hypothetical protein
MKLEQEKEKEKEKERNKEEKERLKLEQEKEKEKEKERNKEQKEKDKARIKEEQEREKAAAKEQKDKEKERAKLEKEQEKAKEKARTKEEREEQKKKERQEKAVAKAEAKERAEVLKNALKDRIQSLGLTLPMKWRPCITQYGGGFEMMDGQIFSNVDNLVKHLYDSNGGVFPRHCYVPYVSSYEAAVLLLTRFAAAPESPNEGELAKMSEETKTSKQALTSWFQKEQQRNGACRTIQSEERNLVEGSAKSLALKSLKNAEDGMALHEIVNVNCPTDDKAEKALLTKRLETALKGHAHAFVVENNKYYLRVKKAPMQQRRRRSGNVTRKAPPRARKGQSNDGTEENDENGGKQDADGQDGSDQDDDVGGDCDEESGDEPAEQNVKVEPQDVSSDSDSDNAEDFNDEDAAMMKHLNKKKPNGAKQATCNNKKGRGKAQANANTTPGKTKGKPGRRKSGVPTDASDVQQLAKAGLRKQRKQTFEQIPLTPAGKMSEEQLVFMLLKALSVNMSAESSEQDEVTEFLQNVLARDSTAFAGIMDGPDTYSNVCRMAACRPASCAGAGDLLRYLQAQRLLTDAQLQKIYKELGWKKDKKQPGKNYNYGAELANTLVKYAEMTACQREMREIIIRELEDGEEESAEIDLPGEDEHADDGVDMEQVAQQV